MWSMGLQLVTSRVLAPSSGNSIFVWGSLITTFLAAFSTGSFVGAAVSGWIPAIQRKIILAAMVISTDLALLRHRENNSETIRAIPQRRAV